MAIPAIEAMVRAFASEHPMDAARVLESLDPSQAAGLLKRLPARLAYVNFDGARALAAAETIPLDRPIEKDFLERYCAPTLEAVERLSSWVG
jgi:hypothetical protein